jgi:hypothetical protein
LLEFGVPPFLMHQLEYCTHHAEPYDPVGGSSHPPKLAGALKMTAEALASMSTIFFITVSPRRCPVADRSPVP